MKGREQKDLEHDEAIAQLGNELTHAVTALGEKQTELSQKIETVMSTLGELNTTIVDLQEVVDGLSGGGGGVDPDPGPINISGEIKGSLKAGEEVQILLYPVGMPDAIRLVLNGSETIFDSTNELDMDAVIEYSFINPEGMVSLQAFAEKDMQETQVFTFASYDAGVIDTPGKTVEATVINKGTLVRGSEGFFEVLISVDGEEATSNIAGLEYVEFYVNGTFENKEKNWRYESWPTIPDTDQVTVYAEIVIDGNLYVSDTLTATTLEPIVNPPSEDPWYGLDQYDTILFENDGYPDPDDIASIVIQGLYAERCGILDKFHIFAGNHINDPGPAAQEQKLQESLTFVANRGVQTHNFRADDTWADEMQYHTALLSSGKVLVLAGGPMATLHYSLAMVDPAQRENITVVSHSQWNEDRAEVTDPKIPAKTWTDCKEDFPEVRFIDIANQNGWGSQSNGFNNSAWSELQNTGIGILEQAWEVMGGATVGGDANKQHDASDFGMLFAAANQGKEDGEPSDVIPQLVSHFRPMPTDPVIPEFSVYADDVYGVEMSALAKQNPVVWYTEFEDQQNDLDDDYVTFMGDDAFSNWQESSVVAASIEVAESGTYVLEAFNRSGDKNSTSDFNDTWIRIQTPEFYAEKPGLSRMYAKDNLFNKGPVTSNNDSSKGAFKFYTNTKGEWDLTTYAVDNQLRTIKVDLVAGERYLVELSGRSKGHSIHSLWLRKEDTTTQDSIRPALPTFPGPGDPVPGPGNYPVGIEMYDQFIAEAVGDWYNWTAEALPLSDGPLDDAELRSMYNAGDSKMGKPNPRVFLEEVEFKGQMRRAVNFSANNQSSGFWDRLSVPKSAKYSPEANQVATKISFFTIAGEKTGNFDQDRKTKGDGFHAKGFGLQSPDGPPPPGKNPEGANSPSITNDPAEFVLWSTYGPTALQRNGKGDQTGVEIGSPTKYTKESTLWQMDVNFGNDEFDKRFFQIAVGVYARDVYDYKYQSQLYPVLPNPDGSLSTTRFLFEVGEEYDLYFVAKPNTHNPDGSWNADGEFYFWIRTDKVNNGEPWLAAKMTNRTFTTQYIMKFAEAGAGLYLNPGDEPDQGDGFWFTGQSLHYK